MSLTNSEAGSACSTCRSSKEVCILVGAASAEIASLVAAFDGEVPPVVALLSCAWEQPVISRVRAAVAQSFLTAAPSELVLG